MSKLEALEREIEQLPREDIEQLCAWINAKAAALKSWSSAPFRDHSAFLNGYCPEDEGLYDDATTG